MCERPVWVGVQVESRDVARTKGQNRRARDARGGPDVGDAAEEGVAVQMGEPISADMARVSARGKPWPAK